jgi:hypothetical protein
MAYSNAWDPTRPSGAVAANQIDTEIQAVRLDLQERLKTLFGITTFTADPLQGVALNMKGASASKIIAGSTSLSLRNNADSADNLLISDAGAVTARAYLSTPSIVGSSSVAVGAGVGVTANLHAFARGPVFVHSFTGVALGYCMLMVDDLSGTLVLVSQSTHNLYSLVPGTAGKLNFFYAANTLQVENRTGVAVTLKYLPIYAG